MCGVQKHFISHANYQNIQVWKNWSNLPDTLKQDGVKAIEANKSDT